jgi:hypothetical protein
VAQENVVFELVWHGFAHLSVTGVEIMPNPSSAARRQWRAEEIATTHFHKRL